MFNQAELRKRPTYNELIQEIEEDVRIVLPDRRAKFLRDSPYLSYLDNETYLEIEDQQKKMAMQQQTEQTIRQVASSSGQTASVVRAQNRSEAKQATRGFLSSLYSRASPQKAQTADPDDFFSPSSPSGEPQIAGAISMVSPELKSVLNESEPKPLNLASLFSDVADAQPHEQLAEQLTQNLGQISKAMNGGGSASSSSAAAAMDESAPMEDDKSGIKRKDKVASEDTRSPPRARAKGMAKQTPDSKAQLRTIIDASTQTLTGREIQSLTANVNNGFEIPAAIQNSVSKGKLDELKAMQLEKEYENLMADLAQEGGYADMKSDVAGKKAPKPPKGGERAVKTDKFKKDYKPPDLKRKVNPKTGFVEMGTDMDKSTAKSHWNTKGIGYIKDQLELRGFKIPNAQLTGANKLKKKDLLGMLYRHDKI